MGLQQAKIKSLPFVTAELNYLAPTADKPRTYTFDPPPGEPRSTALPESHRLPIFDARTDRRQHFTRPSGLCPGAAPDLRQELP